MSLTKRKTEHNKTKQTRKQNKKKSKSNTPLCDFRCAVQKAESKMLFIENLQKMP